MNPNNAETKEHILRAGRELLLAARGALAFCKRYAETNTRETANPQLVQFFTRALAVVDELGKDLLPKDGFKKVLEEVMKYNAARRPSKKPPRRRASQRKQRSP